MYSKFTHLTRFASVCGFLCLTLAGYAQEEKVLHINFQDAQSNPIVPVCTLTVKKGKGVTPHFSTNSSVALNLEGNRRYELTVVARGYKKQSISQKIYDGVAITLQKDAAYIDTLAIADRAREAGKLEVLRQYEPQLREAQDEVKRKNAALKASEKKIVALRDSVVQQQETINNLGGEVAILRVQQQQIATELTDLKTTVKGIKDEQDKKVPKKSILDIFAPKKKEVKKIQNYTPSNTSNNLQGTSNYQPQFVEY